MKPIGFLTGRLLLGDQWTGKHQCPSIQRAIFTPTLGPSAAFTKERGEISILPDTNSGIL